MYEVDRFVEISSLASKYETSEPMLKLIDRNSHYHESEHHESSFLASFLILVGGGGVE